MLIILLPLTACQKQSSSYVIHVSPQGRDEWSGQLAQPNSAQTDGPLQSLAAAQNAIRLLKRENKISPNGITVQLHHGAYWLAETLTLSDEDSGADSAAIIWQAAPGETAIISGGQEIRGFTPVTDPAVLQRFAENARAHIVQTTVVVESLAALSEKEGPGLEVFFNDSRLQRARYPNSGYLKIAEVPQAGGKVINEGSWQWKRFGIPVGRHCGRIRYKDEGPRRWQPAKDIWLHGYFCWDWRDGFQQVQTIDATQQEITLAPPYHEYGFHREQRFYFLNVLEALDQPGEWYLEHASGTLYLWPPAPVENASVKISKLNGPLLALENASHLRFENLTFELSRKNAIEIRGGRHNVLAGCTVRNVGMTAIVIDGGNAHGVQSCDIYQIGGGGMVLNSGDRKTLTSGNSFVDNTHFYDFGQVRKTTCPAIDARGVGTRLSHNLLHDSPDAGIMYWGNEMRLEYNEVHHLAKESDDVGAFYCGRDYTMRGNVIRYNYFHHLQKPMHVGVMAVYLDDFSSGATIFGNIFYKAGRAVFMGGGRDHRIENNIFVENVPSIFLDARGLVRNTEFFDGRITTLTDRLHEMNYTAPPYSEKYPMLLTLYQDEPARPKYNRIQRNISLGGRWLDLYSGLDLEVLEMENNVIADSVLFRTSVETGVETENFTEHGRDDSAIAARFAQRGNQVLAGDSSLMNLSKGDFRLRENSPALPPGFEKIPVEKIGLYRDAYRKFLPKKFSAK